MFAELPQEPQAVPAPPGSPSADERMWAMLACLSGIIFWWLGPLVIWLIQKDKMPFVDEQGKEALNFEITMTIGLIAVAIVSSILGAILTAVNLGFIALLFGLLYPVILICNLVLPIIAGLKANEGTLYRYPFSLRLVK